MVHAGVSYGPVGDNTPPTVEITSPVSGTVIPFEATTVTATASDSNGTVTQVNFYANAALIGSDGTAPCGISGRRLQLAAMSLAPSPSITPAPRRPPPA
jgi:chitinase